jgi:hypothetical protein
VTSVTAVGARPSVHPHAVLLRLAPLGVPFVLALVAVDALTRSEVTSTGPYGLISELPPVMWAVWLALTAHFLLLLRERRLDVPGLVATLGVWAFTLHAAPTLLEAQTRFGASWRIGGFVEYIARTGHTLPQVDARMSWPGILAALAGVSQATGLDPMTVARWWPILVELLTLLLAGGIFAACLPQRRTRWVALWILVPANWVGQDYYSPQSVSLLLYLGVVLVLLTWFGSRELVVGPLMRLDHLRSGIVERFGAGPAAPVVGTTPGQRLALSALLVVATIALAVGHQLTPTMLVAAAAALFLAGRSRFAGYAVLVVAITAAYVSYFAVPYWSGHLHDIFGGVGKVGGSVQSGVASRAVGSFPHRLVVDERIAFSLALGCVGAFGAVRWLRLRRLDLALPLLVLAPVVAVALQSYGGEVVLRVFVFASVPLAACIGLAFAPTRMGGLLSARATAALAVLTLLALPLFMLARYGNEAYEMVRPGEAAVSAHLYSVAQPGATIAVYGGANAIQERRIEDYHFTDVHADLAAGRFDAIADALAANPHGGWLLLTESQQLYGVAVGVLPAGWRTRLTHELVDSGRFRIQTTNGDATLFVPIGAPS